VFNRQFDFTVCWAGTSGSVVAGRLAANPAVNVLLLEAGGTDEKDSIIDPNSWPTTWSGSFATGWSPSGINAALLQWEEALWRLSMAN
jgi:choline dehydrogenase-like flavoprotein